MTFTTGQIVAFVIGLLGAVLTILNIIDKYSGLKDKSEAPFKLLSDKVNEHENRLNKVESSLYQGNEHFRRQEALNEVFINCMLAFIDFEMAYCSATGYKEIEDLETAKSTLRKYLARNSYGRSETYSGEVDKA
jgi:hypothetical protein